MNVKKLTQLKRILKLIFSSPWTIAYTSQKPPEMEGRAPVLDITGL